MDCFSSLPWISKGLVCRGADVASDETVHGFGSDIGCSLSGSSNLGDLSVKYALLVRVNLEGGKHIDLLYQKHWGILFSQLLSNFGQKSCSICVFVCFAVELNSLHLFVLLNQHVGVLLKELFNGDKVVLLGKLHCKVPLVQ